MEFSEQELGLIARAKKKSSELRMKRIAIIVIAIAAVALMVSGVTSTDKTAYLLIAAVFFSLALPQLGEGPKYEDLVALLDKKSCDNRS